MLAGLQTQTDGSVWMSIPRGLVIKDPTPRRIQFFEDEISIDGEPLSLSSKQYLALSCFQYKNTVREVEVAAAVYKDITKNHDAIYRVFERLEKRLERFGVWFSYENETWTLRFRETQKIS